MTAGRPVIEVPAALADSYDGPDGRAFVAGLPALAAGFLERWELRLDGSAMHGRCALVLPVVGADGTRAVLKRQPVDDENIGEADALRSGGCMGLEEAVAAVRLKLRESVEIAPMARRMLPMRP